MLQMTKNDLDLVNVRINANNGMIKQYKTCNTMIKKLIMVTFNHDFRKHLEAEHKQNKEDIVLFEEKNIMLKMIKKLLKSKKLNNSEIYGTFQTFFDK